ncbi:MAG: type II toxin-antitoxin system RelE/ParE family toxin [Thermoguttaceae bacterium]
MKIVWSKIAADQIQEILLYYNVRNGSAHYSQKLYEAIVGKLSQINHNTILGIKTDIQGVYRLRVAAYMIEYCFHEDLIQVLAVFDARSDVNADQFGL